MLRSLIALFLVTSQANALSLTPDQRAAVAEARQRYRVRVLAHPTGDVVVLLGERHVKMRKNHELGKSVLTRFGTRGLEAEDGAEMSRAMRSQERMTGSLFGGLNKITNGRGPYGSTLTDALSVEPLPENGDLKIVPLERLAAGESMHPTTHMFYAEYSLAQLALPLSFVKVFGIGTWARRYLFFVAPVLVASGYIGYAFARPWEEATWAEKVALHLYYGVLERRNDLIAKNIVRSREERQGQPMLAIMGSAHVKGITNLLVKKYGYEIVEPAPGDATLLTKN